MIVTAVILAAGQGTRMRSALPKVLHQVAGRPLVQYSLDAVTGLCDDTPVLVVGHAAETVQAAVGIAARYALQAEQLGTGHAVRMAEPLLQGNSDLVVVIYADMPLLSGETIQRLVDQQRANDGPISMLTIEVDDPRGFGRIVRAPDGSVQAIVEEAQCSIEQLTIRELNVGVYCFDSDWLWDALERVPLSPKGEYYLTDTVGLATEAGLAVQAITMEDPADAMGINTRVHLAEAEAIMRSRTNKAWMESGVTMPDPSTVYIEQGVAIGRDTIIMPNTHLHGETRIGESCVIGPNSIIDDCQIGNGCRVLSSVLEKAVMDDGADIGPFGRLRKGAHLGEGVHMGNFGEVKDSYLAPGVKMGHFSYIGNATIGEDVNIGAGTITCNYDGVNKYPTDIGAGTFIGSDTMLVAPLKIGKNAITGAGAVVKNDVQDNQVVAGVPARPIKKK
jgi:bifunctional UDP-N-acetylglucosamine pyrophosphorylase / glucosamine-1-phosphate N-acetyltransferase